MSNLGRKVGIASSEGANPTNMERPQWCRKSCTLLSPWGVHGVTCSVPNGRADSYHNDCIRRFGSDIEELVWNTRRSNYGCWRHKFVALGADDGPAPPLEKNEHLLGFMHMRGSARARRDAGTPNLEGLCAETLRSEASQSVSVVFEARKTGVSNHWGSCSSSVSSTGGVNGGMVSCTVRGGVSVVNGMTWGRGVDCISGANGKPSLRTSRAEQERHEQLARAHQQCAR